MDFVLPSGSKRDGPMRPNGGSALSNQILFVDDDQNLLDSFTRNLRERIRH